MEEQNEKIYAILKQENIAFTIFREIDTILFDCKHSSSKLRIKIIKNASQYHDTQIILDLGINHSNNMIRRLITALRIDTINSPKIVLRFQKNDKDNCHFFQYFNLVPQMNNLENIIYFEPQYDIKLYIHYMEFQILSDQRLRILLNETKFDIKYCIIADQQKGKEPQNIIIDGKTKLPLFMNLEEIIIHNLPLYGFCKNKLEIDYQKLVFIKILVSEDQKITEESCHTFLDDLKEYSLYRDDFQAEKIHYSNVNQMDTSQLFDKVQLICKKQAKLKQQSFYSIYELLEFSNYGKQLVNYINDLSSQKVIAPEFKIESQINLLQLQIQNKKKSQIDPSEYILRIKHCQQIQHIEVDITYDNLWKNYEFSISDVLDLLSKLKGVTYYNVRVQKMIKYQPQFSFTYSKFDLKQKTQQDTKTKLKNVHILQQSQDQLELVPYLILRENANNFTIKYLDSLVNIQSFHNGLTQILSKNKANNKLTLSYIQLLRNNASLSQAKEFISLFKYVNLEFQNTDQLHLCSLQDGMNKKIRKIKIINSLWSSKKQVSSLISQFPNLLKLDFQTQIYYSNKVYLTKLTQLQKYLNVKRSLFFILKTLKMKRLEMMNDLIQDFLC